MEDKGLWICLTISAVGFFSCMGILGYNESQKSIAETQAVIQLAEKYDCPEIIGKELKDVGPIIAKNQKEKELNRETLRKKYKNMTCEEVIKKEN